VFHNAWILFAVQKKIFFFLLKEASRFCDLKH